MCGIVGAVSEQNVAPLLLEILKLLEYEGYDAANVLVVNSTHKIERLESLNKVVELEKQFKLDPINGKTGIANTNWSRRKHTSQKDINPHIADDEIALIQNGLLINYEELRVRLLTAGYSLTTNSDSELIGYLVYHYTRSGQTLLDAIRSAEKEFQGAFAICFIDRNEPNRLKALRRGSSLVIGLGVEANFIASDYTALLKVAQRFIYLEEGDIADITSKEVTIYDKSGGQVEREIFTVDTNNEMAKRGKYNHFMLKEIYEQPDTILTTLQGRLNDKEVWVEGFGLEAPEYFSRIHRVQIVASGACLHAALVGRYWLEAISGIPCQVDAANQTRYRERIVEPNTLFVTLSQSGETLETLNALRISRNLGYIATLTIGNAPGSSIVTESDLVLITGAGTGESVTAIKDFTAQLTALFLLALSLGRYHKLNAEKEAMLAKKLRDLPLKAHQTLQLESTIKNMVSYFADQERALYLGNGIQLPVAMEGAMKLKEISSIYAEAYIVDEFDRYEINKPNAPIVALVAQSDEYVDEIIPKVRDRKGQMMVFADENHKVNKADFLNIITMPPVDKLFAPITYIIPMQLLAYHIALSKGSDTDKPRYEVRVPRDSKQ